MPSTTELPPTVTSCFENGHGAASCRELLAAGATDNDLERWTRHGLVVRETRGRYVLPHAHDVSADRHQQARADHLSKLAAALTAAPDAVAGLRSAAMLHHLPVSSVPLIPEIIRHPDRPHLSGTRTVRTTLLELDRERLDNLETTSLERTGVDVALDLRTQSALMTVDAALAQGASLQSMWQILRARGSVRGCRSARQTLSWADGHAASALESMSRFELMNRSVPRPQCNVWLSWRGTRYCVDDFWPEWGIVGESDGRIKYEGSLAVGDTLWQEKLRQEWIEQLSLLVVRWTTPEIRTSAEGVADRWFRLQTRRQREPWHRPDGLTIWQNPLPNRRTALARQFGG